jgi:glycosyltransferase involved in cell wall biosynthesis
VDKSRVEVFCVERRWNNDPTLPLRLSRQLRRRPIDILHTHSWGTLVEGALAATLARVPTVVHGEHGLLESHRRHIAVQRWLWPRTDQLLAVSAQLANQMSQLVNLPRQKIEVVLNGVDTERFHSEYEVQADHRAYFGLPATGQLIGTVARLVPVKNCLGLLHAVAKLRLEGIRVAVALAGDGPLRGELMQTAHELQISDAVHFLGDVADVDRFYRAIDIFVLNSHSEGMSNTILEAMASGLPVVATDVGSNSELIAAERTGIIVPAGDVVQLADALAGLIRRPARCRALGIAARRRAVDEYSLDRMVQNYESVYERLAGRRLVSAVCPTAVTGDSLPTSGLK